MLLLATERCALAGIRSKRQARLQTPGHHATRCECRTARMSPPPRVPTATTACVNTSPAVIFALVLTSCSCPHSSAATCSFDTFQSGRRCAPGPPCPSTPAPSSPSPAPSAASPGPPANPRRRVCRSVTQQRSTSALTAEAAECTAIMCHCSAALAPLPTPDPLLLLLPMALQLPPCRRLTAPRALRRAAAEGSTPGAKPARRPARSCGSRALASALRHSCGIACRVRAPVGHGSNTSKAYKPC